MLSLVRLSPLTKLVIQASCLLFLAVGVGMIAYARRAESIDRTSTVPGPSPEPGAFQGPASKHLSDSGFVGVVVAGKAVDIAPKLVGRVDVVHARVGERLASNAPIATLDTASIRQELAMGEAKLRVARADEDKASAELAQARDTLVTLTGLQKSGHVSVKELEGSRYQERASTAAFDAARAHVGEAQANVAQLKERMADAHIRAPFPGIVSERYLDPGSMAGPTTPLIRLISSEELRVRFAVPEENVGSVALGMAIRAEVTALNVILSGVIENIAPEVDIASRHVFAEARVEPPEGFKKTIPSGLVARVSVVAPVHTGAH